MRAGRRHCTVRASVLAAAFIVDEGPLSFCGWAARANGLPLSSSRLPTPGARRPRIVRVGGAGIPSIADAARIAKDGDTVEVPAGKYRGDVAVWGQKRLRIRAVNGRAVLFADGRDAEGKGTWVIKNGDFEVEGFDFVGARVQDRNGAGIRFERGSLVVRDCRFMSNENGILTGNDGVSRLEVDRCLFSENGHGDGQSHNLYVGRIDELIVRGSYFRRARVGHLLKSRARRSDVSYNRVTDETGTASYELEFPNGGMVSAVGNLIEQGPATENPTIVAYGASADHWPLSCLVFAHNTVINRRASGGFFIKTWPGETRVLVANNLFVGNGKLSIDFPFREVANAFPPLDAFVDPSHFDYRPKPSASFVGAAVGPRDPAWPVSDPLLSYALTHRYVHERRLAPRMVMQRDTPGAFLP
jgi:hypothetical protein